MSSAYLILIGNELLSGKVRDTNGAYALEVLRANGVETIGLEMIPDEHGRIVEAVRRVRHQLKPSLLITSGGIGPTHDDITMRALAEALERPIERHAEMEAQLHTYYGEKINDEVLSMAELPRGAELAFGESFFPLIRIAEVLALPGEPSFFRAKIDRLVAELAGGQTFVTHKLTFALGESRLAATLRQVQQKYPEVMIGSYPRLDSTSGRWVTLVTFDGDDSAKVQAAHDALLAEVPAESLLATETS